MIFSSCAKHGYRGCKINSKSRPVARGGDTGARPPLFYPRKGATLSETKKNKMKK